MKNYLLFTGIAVLILFVAFAAIMIILTIQGHTDAVLHCIDKIPDLIGGLKIFPIIKA